MVEDKKFHAPFGRIIYFTNMYKYPIPHLKIIGAAKEGHGSQKENKQNLMKNFFVSIKHPHPPLIGTRFRRWIRGHRQISRAGILPKKFIQHPFAISVVATTTNGH